MCPASESTTCRIRALNARQLLIADSSFIVPNARLTNVLREATLYWVEYWRLAQHRPITNSRRSSILFCLDRGPISEGIKAIILIFKGLHCFCPMTFNPKSFLTALQTITLVTFCFFIITAIGCDEVAAMTLSRTSRCFLGMGSITSSAVSHLWDFFALH